MAIAGVFVGVAAHEDPRIPPLHFAKRDARRLEALFADGNAVEGAGTTTLLVDEGATSSAVLVAIAAGVATVAAGKASLLLVHLSCHGTPSGGIVTYDTDLKALDETTLLPKDLANALAPLDVGQVVLTLDCCFGGAVQGMEGSPNKEAFDELVRTLAGEGRFVAWAAGPQELAYESSKLGHGYLSFALAKALESARASGRIVMPVLTWLSDAIGIAAQQISSRGLPQTPGMIAVTTASAVLPVPAVGPRQRGFAHEDGILGVTDAVQDLAQYGFVDPELTAVQQRIGAHNGLNQLQRDAIAPGGLLVGQSVLVKAPTSGGKTLIGELAALQQVRHGMRAVIVLPMRALVNEQVSSFRDAYAALGVRVIGSTGELVADDDQFFLGQYDVAFITYEKLLTGLGSHPTLINGIGAVILDEIQLIGDASRGKTVELLLMRFRRAIASDGALQLIVLCGEVGKLNQFEAWLNCTPIGPGVRPIPLTLGVVAPSGKVRSKAQDSEQEGSFELPEITVAGNLTPKEKTIVRIVLKVLRDGGHVLVFAGTKRMVVRLAEVLAAELELAPVTRVVELLEEVAETDRHRATQKLLGTVRNGVGFHLADLERSERLAVEGAFRAGDLRVLVSTTTLAMGINTPADTVIIADTVIGRDTPLSVPLYRNMSGRAGRSIPGGPEAGTSYLVADNDLVVESLWQRYVLGEPELLGSGLSEMSLEDLIVGIVLMRTKATVVDLVADTRGTYWGHKEAATPDWERRLRRRVDATVLSLVDQGFLSTVAGPTVELTEYGRICATGGLSVESARRVRAALIAIQRSPDPVDGLTLLALSQITSELDVITVPPYSNELLDSWPQNRRGPLNGRESTYSQILSAASAEGSEGIVGKRLHRVGGLIAWLKGLPLRDLETTYSPADRGPALRMLREAAERTVDILPAITRLVIAVVPESRQELLAALQDLRARLEVGGNSAAGRLVRLRVGLSRRNCLDLAGLGIDGEEGFKAALRERRNEVEAVLTTSRTHEVEAALSRPGAAKRRRVQDTAQLLLDLLGDGSTEL
jgi:helicase